MTYRKFTIFFIMFTILTSIIWHGLALAAKEQATMALPGPISYDVKNGESMIIVFAVPPEMIKPMIPAPLAPSPFNIMYVVVSRMPMESGYYQEMTLFALVTYKEQQFGYPVYYMTDNKTISDRELAATGTPAKIGKITLVKNDKTFTASAEREGKVLFKADMILGEPGEPVDNVAVVNLRMAPGKEKGAPFALKQLFAVKLENLKVHELVDGEVTMEFDQSLADGFPKVSVQQLLRTLYRKYDFTLMEKGILHDYLKGN